MDEARTLPVDGVTPAGEPVVDRPRLQAELAQALRRRLTVVVADAGFGKSLLLGAWAAGAASVWYTVGPDDASLAVFALGLARALAGRFPAVADELRLVATTSLGPEGDEIDRAGPLATLLCEGLERELGDDLALVLDDVHELGRTGPSPRFLEALCRQAPPRLHLVLGSRVELPFPVQRLRGRGDVLDLDASMLAFDESEVAELLERGLGAGSGSLARGVYEVTAGWPAAVRLVVESLRPVAEPGRPEAVRALRRPGGPLFDYVAEEVFGRAAPGVRQLLRRVAPFERFDVDFCRAIGIRTAADSLASLRRSGLFVEHRVGDGSFALHALVREFVRARWPLDAEDSRRLHARAATWFAEHERYDEAVDALLAAGDDDRAARLLEEHGEQLIASGQLSAAIRAGARLPIELRSSSIERLVGEAHEVRGEWDEALECFERAAGSLERLDPGLAWRLGLIHHLRGRLDEALEAYERGVLERGSERDAALLLAWQASVHWLRGEADLCRAAAEAAYSLATAAGDVRALAAAHTVLAMLAALTGDRLANDAHYLRALEYAERAGDVLQLARVRTNRGSQHLEEGEYEPALAELELATRFAELSGFAFFHALALANRGEVRFRLGRLEEAVADLEASKALYQKAGSRMVAYPLALLGEVYRERGDSALARAFYEEALQNAEDSGDVQALVPVLCGLAELLAAEDPGAAAELARRALAAGEGMDRVTALVAAAWTALASGDRIAAAATADDAAAAARLRRDRAGLARALEIAALAADGEARREARLEEAVSLWRAVGSPVREARAELLLGLSSGGPDAAARVERAERRLRAAGARGYRAALAPVLAPPSAAADDGIVVATLGRFAVLRGGRAVGATEWQSKKARDLLKILVARRGRATPREALMEALWPEEDPRRVANRLSVALSTLRAVLDPERRRPADHFLVGTGEAVALRAETVAVDVERFLVDAAHALELDRAGDPAAGAALETAEAAYVGDFLEEDLYEDWATPLREEARAAYLAVARALSDRAETAGEADAAIRYRLRMIERDPYDERSHLGLARALAVSGRHGEARRAYRRYVERMAEIGVEAAPFPGGTSP